MRMRITEGERASGRAAPSLGRREFLHAIVEIGRGVLERLPQVLILEIGIRAMQLLTRSVGGGGEQHATNGEPHPTDARLAVHLLRVDGDAVQLRHEPHYLTSVLDVSLLPAPLPAVIAQVDVELDRGFELHEHGYPAGRHFLAILGALVRQRDLGGAGEAEGDGAAEVVEGELVRALGAENAELIEGLLLGLPAQTHVDIAVCPPNVYLWEVGRLLKDSIVPGLLHGTAPTPKPSTSGSGRGPKLLIRTVPSRRMVMTPSCGRQRRAPGPEPPATQEPNMTDTTASTSTAMFSFSATPIRHEDYRATIRVTR